MAYPQKTSEGLFLAKLIVLLLLMIKGKRFFGFSPNISIYLANTDVSLEQRLIDVTVWKSQNFPNTYILREINF